MIAIIEVGSPLSQRGWRWSGGRRRKSPLRRRCSLGEEEADKDSKEGNKQAYFWPCGFKMVKEKRVVFFWISPPFLGFPISLPFKNVCSVLSNLCREKLFLHQGYTKTKLSEWPRCPNLPFQPREARRLQNLQKRCPTCFKHDEKMLNSP